MEFETELKKLGLKDKEAAVYLACLELGSAPVQVIARRAKVVRATTYVILEALMAQGLVTTFKQGKKTLFSAEPPRQLLRLLEKQHDVITEKKHNLEALLPELQALMRQDGAPTVRYFEGKEGLHTIRQEIVMNTPAGDIVYNLTPVDYLKAIFPNEEQSYYRHRLAKGIHSRTIFTTRSETLKRDILSHASPKLSERRYVAPDVFPSTSGMTIYGDRIALGSFVGKLMGVVIESRPMADMMKRLFNMVWSSENISKDKST